MVSLYLATERIHEAVATFYLTFPVLNPFLSHLPEPALNFNGFS